MSLGERLAGFLKPGAVVFFTAGLGAGKTTFTKGIARGLGITEAVTSPTYTIISEYHGQHTLYHIDLYRIEEEDLQNLGLREILCGNGVAVVEWAEKLLGAEDYNPIRITIRIEGDSLRVFEITLPGGEDAL